MTVKNVMLDKRDENEKLSLQDMLKLLPRTSVFLRDGVIVYFL